MVKRVNLVGFMIVVVFCLLLIIYNQKTTVQDYRRNVHYSDLIELEYSVHNDTLNSPMREIIRRQRYLIEQETKDYIFLPGTRLTNYTPFTRGKPIRNIIVTTWRSGSTFLGDVLNAVPANFYHYEPLLDYGIIQVRGPPYAESAIDALKSLLDCDYSEMQRYLNFGKTHEYLFTHNNRLWSQCDPYNLCWNSTFLTDFCRQFPFQSMKIVRLRLKLAEELLKDEFLNVKVLLLVRDPRGTLQSRKHRDWCPGAPDCDNPNLLCADMVSDYSAAVQLQSKYPSTFRAIRYEDLSLKPYEMVRSLFRFFELDFHPNVKAFLDSHTKSNLGGVSSTFRDSKSAPFHWRTDLNASEIQYIEENCDEAMKLWGYVKIKGEGNLKDFDPLTSYVIN